MRPQQEIETMIVQLHQQIAAVRAEVVAADTKKQYTNSWFASQYAYIDEMQAQVAALRWVLGMTDWLMSVDVVQP